VDASAVVVKPIEELASPPDGSVTVDGRAIPMPVGTFPIQDAEKVTGALNPLTEFTVTAVALFRPGVVETVSDVGVIVKSPMLTGAGTAGVTGTMGVTGAGTANVPPIPPIATGMVVVWERTPLVAIITRS